MVMLADVVAFKGRRGPRRRRGPSCQSQFATRSRTRCADESRAKLRIGRAEPEWIYDLIVIDHALVEPAIWIVQVIDIQGDLELNRLGLHKPQKPIHKRAKR